MTRSVRRWGIAALVGLAGALALIGYRATRAIEVTLVSVTRGPLVVSVTPVETGTVETEETAWVKAETSGRVVRLDVREGDTVKAGALLVALDAEEAQARLTLARSSLSVSRARLKSARIAFQMETATTGSAVAQAEAVHESVAQRHQKRTELAREGLVSADEMDTLTAELNAAAAALAAAKANREQVALREQEVAAAEAEVAQQEASIRLAELELAHSQIRAPLAGTVMSLPIKVGELVLQGTPVAQISRQADLHIKALIDEVDLARVKLGQPVSLSFDVLPGETFGGRVWEISPSVSVERLKSRNVEVKIRFDDPPPSLRPGLSADVEIVVAKVGDALFVPSETVMMRNGRSVVYVVENDRVEERTVVTGHASWESTEILEGLHEGESIVSSLDIAGLEPGVRVTASAPSS